MAASPFPQRFAEMLLIAIFIVIGVVIAFLKRRVQAAFVQKCSQKLKDKNRKVRQSAIDDLRTEITAHLRIGKEKKASARHIVNFLLRALRDEDWRIRETTAALLANQIDEYPIDLSSFKNNKGGGGSPFFWLRKSVVRRMVMPFLRAVKDQNPNVRKEAVVALGKIYDRIRDTRVISPLIMALKIQRRESERTLQLLWEHSTMLIR